ncbi:MAG: hypothetical protein NTW05_24050 [Pseudonocardiales bacterium]|nr:hypothetical protein [Pseudonocardiales bacterium]
MKDGGPAAPGGSWRRALPRLPLALSLAAVVLAGLSIVLPNIAPGVAFMAAEGSPVRLFFGVSEEMNLPTAFSVGTFVMAATAHALVGWLVGGRTGRAFLVVAALLGLLAFDDFAALHERLDVLVDLGDADIGYTWMIPALVVAAGVVVAFVRLAGRLSGAARRDLLVGIGVFLLGSFGLEAVNGLLDRPGTDGAPLQVGTHVEEVVENLGIILVLRAALGVVEVSGGRGGFSVRVVPELAAGPRRRSGAPADPADPADPAVTDVETTPVRAVVR